MNYRLSCHPRFELGGRKGWSRQIDVLDSNGSLVGDYVLMCSAIDGDIQSAEGSGACVLEWIRKVETGEIDFADVDGNAWIMNITRDKVWFEGLYRQGEGGEVSFAQYKLAVQTYVRFLADPEGKTIEVAFPDR
jgi:hypothetical protein